MQEAQMRVWGHEFQERGKESARKNASDVHRVSGLSWFIHQIVWDVYSTAE